MKTIVAIPGRYQPFHSGHYQMYNEAVTKFGKKNVWITTADQQEKEPQRYPFNFKEKQTIIHQLYKIPKSRIVFSSNPNFPKELLDKFDLTKSIYILVLSQKDANRFPSVKKDGSPAYFQPYEENKDNLEPANVHGYIYIADVKRSSDNNIQSASQIRQKFRDQELSKNEKKKYFQQVYGKLDPLIFDIYYQKFN